MSATETLYRRIEQGKRVRYEPAVESAEAADAMPVNSTPMNDMQKAMMLHLGLASFESVRSDESPRSARYTRLTRAMDRILEQIDIYRIEAWPAKEVSKAGCLVDEFNMRIAQVFGSAKGGR